MGELHKCKYCGVETTQPDDECYAKPAKELTAVEWFVSQLKAKKWEDWNDIIEQAKEMEKNQMKDSFIEGHNVCRCVTDNTDEAKECFDKWFKTYKILVVGRFP